MLDVALLMIVNSYRPTGSVPPSRPSMARVTTVLPGV
jgi:hypothetical protein